MLFLCYNLNLFNYSSQKIENDIITNSKQQTKAQGQYLLLVKVLKHSLGLGEATGDDESLNPYTIICAS